MSTSPTPAPAGPSPSPEAVSIVRTGSIIGGVFGGLAFIAIVGLTWYWIRRRTPRPPKDEEKRGSINDEAPPPEYTKGDEFEARHKAQPAVELEQPRGHTVGRMEVDAAGSQVHELPVEMCELPASEGKRRNVSCDDGGSKTAFSNESEERRSEMQ